MTVGKILFNLYKTYPNRLLYKTAVAYCDCLTEVPQTLANNLRQLQWSGDWADGFFLCRQANIINKYNNFTKENIHNLVNYLGHNDLIKYKLGRENSVVLYIQIPIYYKSLINIDLERIKQITSADEVYWVDDKEEVLRIWWG